MTIFFQHSELAIEVFDDSAFNNNADSPSQYHKVIQADGDKNYSPTAQHAIKIYRDNELINSAIILATGGATSVQKDSALIDEGNLVIRCCNKLFKLTLPELVVSWMVEPDWATCFSIRKYQNSYISYGETSIARIDRDGKILWQYGGEDIFVCLYEGNPFEMHDDYIALTDFTGNKYRIDYDGYTLDHVKTSYEEQQPIVIPMKQKKPWWKFW